MNRKTLTILIATAVILIGGITFAVMKLYSDSRNDAGNAADSRFLETHKPVKAVPSDAAIIFYLIVSRSRASLPNAIATLNS